VPLRSVVVVGASLAGLRAAETLRAEGFDGRLTVLGEEAHPPYQRPPLSKQLLAGSWERDKVDLRIREDLRVELRTGTRATALDLTDRSVTVVTANGEERIGFDGMVVATGARPRSLPEAMVPDGCEGVHTLRTVDDCIALRAALQSRPRVAVIGGGFIGSEVAATCRDAGAAVTVVEPAPALLHGALGPDLGALVTEIHREHGTEVRTGRAAESVLGGATVEGVRLDDGSTIPADLVVVALGVTPATEWLEESGVRLDDGVVCDSRCRAVEVEGVVAAGDVARWDFDGLGGAVRIEHFDNANHMGAAAARALLHGDSAEPYRPVPWFWSDMHDLRLQMLGVPRAGDELRIVEGDRAARRFVAAYGRDGRTVAVVTVNLPARTARYRAAVEQRVPFPPPPAESRQAQQLAPVARGAAP